MPAMRIRLAPLVALLLCSAAPLRAQLPVTPRALGIGGAIDADARGVEALFVNPANLALPDAPRWSFALPQLALAGTLTGPKVEDMPDLVDDNSLSDARRDELFASIPESGITLDVDSRLPLVAVQVGRVAVGAAYGRVDRATLAKDIVAIMLYGYETGRIDYDVETTATTSADFMDIAAAYATRVGALSLGATAHYIHGRTLETTWAPEPRLDLAARDIEVSYVGIFKEGGRGFGLDLGAAYQTSPKLTLSAALTNAFAWMSWPDEVRMRRIVLRSADFDELDVQDMLDRYRESEQAVEVGEPGQSGGDGVIPLAREIALLREAYFPTVAKLGVAWKPASRSTIAASYRTNLTEGRLAERWDRVLGIGVEQRVAFFGFRVGAAKSLDSGSMLSAGLSLGPLEIGAAKLSLDGPDEGESSGYVFTTGLSYRRGGR